MTSSTTPTQSQSTPCSGTSQDTPASDDALRLFPQYIDRLRSRLEVGKATYGDKSFAMPLADLAEEICQELLDVSGWAFIEYARIQRLMQAVRALDSGRIGSDGANR